MCDRAPSLTLFAGRRLRSRDSASRGTMLKSKTFLKKTRAGGVMKIVREHYLRDDIGCGAPGCAACGGAHEGPVLEPQPLDPESSLCPQPHYLLPDTNVLLHQVRRRAPSGKGVGQLGRLRP